MPKISFKQKVTLILFGILISAALLEAGLRIGGFVYLSLQEFGNRASIKNRGDYTILCLGDSMTASGEEHSYPRQLEEISNQRGAGLKFTVINKGTPGVNTRFILSQLEEYLEEYHPDMVIAMMGINDVGDTRIYEDVSPSKKVSFLSSLKIYRLIRFLRLHIASKFAFGKNKNFQNKTKVPLRITADYKPDLIEAKPDSFEKYFKLGCLCRDREELDKAEEMFKKTLDMEADDNAKCWAFVELANIYLMKEELDKGRVLLEKAIEIFPEHDAPYTDLGVYYVAAEEYDKAKAMLEEAVRHNPGNDAAAFWLAWIYMKEEKYDQVETLIKKVLETDPKNDRAYGLLAKVYSETKSASLGDYLKRAGALMFGAYNPITRQNYRILYEVLKSKKIKMVAVQYPGRDVGSLIRLFNEDQQKNIVFVDNEKIFKDAVRSDGYDEYFNDLFAGDFGHCTEKGNRLLAGNIAKVIAGELF